MIQSFEKDRPLKQFKQTETKANQIVEMVYNFPFGKIQKIIDQTTNVLVRRRLAYSLPSQKRVISQAVQKLEQLSHSSLISLHYSEHKEGYFSLYYEYVHLTLEKWIVNLGDDVLEGLKNQMLDLSCFLNASGVVFTFEPRFVGVNQAMRLKYFINDFSIADAGQEQLQKHNEAANRKAIQSFFQRFKSYAEDNEMFSNSFFDHRETMCESISTRESWSLARNSVFYQTSSKSKITAKLERTKSRTNEILNRLKSIRNLHF